MFGIDLSIILGAVSGLALNAVRVFRSPAGRAASQLLPSAIRLAVKVARGQDARDDADALLKMAPHSYTETDNDEDKEVTVPPKQTRKR